MRLAAHEPKHPAVSDFFRTYPMLPPSFSRCSFIVMYNRGESLRSADLTTRFRTLSSARPKLVALRSKVDELGETCVHGDILPHNVAVDEEGNLALFDYDEAVWFDSSPPERAIPDKATVLCDPNVLRYEYQKEYSAVQFSLIVRFIAEALECSQRESRSLNALRSIHRDLARALNEDFDKEILRQVESLVEAVNSMLSEEDIAAVLLK